jgi:hypothetical protein
MESVGIICERTQAAEVWARVPPKLVHNRVDDRCWVLEESGSACYLNLDDSEEAFIGFAGQNELMDFIRARVADPVMFSLAYRDVEFCKRLLLLLADDPRMIVDNDFDLTVPGDEMARRIRSNPGWDWRDWSKG